MILSIGEVVWDVFPDKQVLGGAPVNVAYHLHCLGVEIGVITRIGNDELGDRTIGTLAALGLPLDGVQKGEEPTGRVNVTFAENGVHQFEIVSPAAWDKIALDPAREMIGNQKFDLVFGTLAQRDETTRRTIRSLWPLARRCFYDVNLRPPFTTRPVVEDSLAAADLVKMNGDELLEIGGWHNLSGEERKTIAHELMGRYNISVLVVTEGAEGAWLMDGDDYFHAEASPVEVSDTVGAGDAFFAALLAGYLERMDWQECLARANERGGYVASQAGATPKMPTE
ncbi:MAG: carbohydrate kinase [Thermodesulfobacteriota bacterium]